MSVSTATDAGPTGSVAVRAALAVASGILLAASLLYPALFALAWCGFVPLLAAVRNATPRQAYALGVVSGATLYVCATHWIVTFIASLKGYGFATSFGLAALLWLFSAQAFGIAMALFVWLKRATRITPVLIFPSVAVATFMAFPTPFPARIGESQSHFLPALQAIEFTGVYGLDFIVAMTNVLVLAWLTRDVAQASPRAMGVGVSLLAVWFAYGVYAAGAWRDRIAEWDSLRVGIVQPNEPPSVGIPDPAPGFARAYPPELQLTQALAQPDRNLGADVIIWPETRFKGYFEFQYVREAFRRNLAPLQTPLLLNDIERVYEPAQRKEFNSVAFLNEAGRLEGVYRKVHLVPFGEYLPLGEYFPSMKTWARDFIGFYQLEAGATPQLFATEKFAIAPLICYELAFPPAVADAVGREPAGKIVVTVSNDTWFGRTRQPLMHGYIAALRAVELRVPVINALNNGPSVVAMPDGRFIFRGDFQRAGGYLVDMPYSKTSGGSFFARHPYWFLTLLYAVLATIVAIALLDARSHRRYRDNPEY